MTRLLLAMLGARRGAAVTVFVLAAVAAAAAAGPLYRGAANSAAASVEIAAADPADLAIRYTSVFHREAPDDPVDEVLNATLPYQPGFDTVFGLAAGGQVTSTRDTGTAGALTYRYGMCQHLVAVTGRCVSGANEVMVSTRTAADMGLAAGDPLDFQAGAMVGSAFSSDGDRLPLTVVGTYQPRDGREPYWAGRIFDTEAVDQTDGADAFFVTKETLGASGFTDVVVSADLVAHPSTFDNPDALVALIQDEVSRGTLSRQNVDSDIPDLLDRIAASQDALADGVRLAAVPLVLLSWFVLYLAVANSAFRRRAESGLAGLRGVPRLTRWWLSTAEYAIPLLAGGGLGYLGGYLLSTVLAGRALPGDPPVRLDTDSATYAAVAVGGALAVGLFAQWRATSAPVATLLRRVPTRLPTARLGPVEVVAVALAVLSGYQHEGALALLTPMFVALAVGLVAARLVGLVADRAGRRALRRGLLGRALACLYLARQPSQARLLGVLVTLFAVLGFAVTAVDVGAAARTARVRAELGAPRVVAVKSVPTATLLAAVRAADPAGRYAMAAARMPGKGTPILGVDATRLARVAIWEPGYGPSAAAVARLLQPRDPAEVRITGAAVEVRATVTKLSGRSRLFARLLAPNGQQVQVDLGELRVGTTTYRATTKDCAGGCRLLRLSPNSASFDRYEFDVTLHELDQRGPDAVVVSPAGFAASGRWTAGTGDQAVTATPVAGGFRVSYAGRIDLASLAVPIGTPRPLPTLATEPLPATIPSGRDPIPVTRAAGLHMVPGLGGTGGLVSLAYADLATTDPSPALDPQVWLTADAPAGLLDRLRAAGLVVVSDRTTAAEIDLLDQRGPALALRFYLLVAIAAVALGVGGLAVVASADRWAQAGQLRALRAQGLSPAVAWRVGFGGYAVLTVIALLLGTLAATVSWWLARTVIPFFTNGGESTYVPAAPGPFLVAGILIGAAVVLAGAGAVAAAGLRRTVESPATENRAVENRAVEGRRR